jgi:hypothetical protein
MRIVPGKHKNGKTRTEPYEHKHSPGYAPVKKENHQKGHRQWTDVAQKVFPAAMNKMAGEHAMPIGNIPGIDAPKILIGCHQIKIQMDQSQEKAKRQ